MSSKFGNFFQTIRGGLIGDCQQAADNKSSSSRARVHVNISLKVDVIDTFERCSCNWIREKVTIHHRRGSEQILADRKQCFFGHYKGYFEALSGKFKFPGKSCLLLLHSTLEMREKSHKRHQTKYSKDELIFFHTNPS